MLAAREELFFFSPTIPTACESSQVRDQTHTTAATRAAAVTKLDS